MSVSDVLRDQVVVPHSAAIALAIGVEEAQVVYDEMISSRAKGWRLERMPMIDRAVLRLALHELREFPDVPTAVDSVKRGAFDFCEKPFSDNALVDRVEQALALSQARLLARQTQQRLQSRLLELTERERDVMRLVVEGLPNKLIADQLDISVRTVEVHRARVFDKMEVKSAVELANLMRQMA